MNIERLNKRYMNRYHRKEKRRLRKSLQEYAFNDTIHSDMNIEYALRIIYHGRIPRSGLYRKLFKKYLFKTMTKRRGKRNDSKAR